MEKSFVMIKPDGVQRELIGEIIGRFEKKGAKIIGLKLMRIKKELAEKHYEVHKGKPFFEELIKFITSGPVVAMVFEGENMVEIVRKMIGATNPANALPGTVRGDFVLDTGQNIIHASDSLENAVREIAIFFKEDELVSYNLNMLKWVYSIPLH